MVYSVFPSDFLHSGYFVFMEFLQGHIIIEANHPLGKARNNLGKEEIILGKIQYSSCCSCLFLVMLLNMLFPYINNFQVWDALQKILASPRASSSLLYSNNFCP